MPEYTAADRLYFPDSFGGKKLEENDRFFFMNY